MHDINSGTQRIVGFEAQPIPQTSNTKPLAITAAFVVGAVIVFCSLTGTRFTHKPIGTVGTKPDGTKYVAPSNNQPSQSPEDVKKFVKDYMDKTSKRIYGE